MRTTSPKSPETLSRLLAVCATAALGLLVATHAPAAGPWNRKAGSSARQSEPRTDGDLRSQPELDLETGKDRAALARQREQAREKIAELERQREGATGKDEKEDIDDNLEILAFVEGWASRTLESNPSEKEVLSANVQIGRILAAVEEPVIRVGYGSFRNLWTNVVMGSAFGHGVPNLSPKRQDSPLTLAEAQEEAVFLYNPVDRSFYSTRQLAGMTPEEVSRLDVSPEHPAWACDESFARTRPGRLKNFEAWMQSGVTDALRAEGDLKGDRTWDLHPARKVLFVEEVDGSGTSPKAATEDAFGVAWKLKWGDETQTESVASRLYLLAGGRMTDANFFSGYGPEAMTLILGKSGDYEEREGDTERTPETLDQLKKALFDFYGFDLTPYIHSHGVVTAGNSGEILRNLPAGGKEKYRGGRLIGRQWISFREATVELKPQGFIHRFDGSRMSDPAALNDRAARGLYLFDLWISNRDVKDYNNKSYFIREPSASGEKMTITGYNEGQHDMGLSLGILRRSGEINGMETGREFARPGLLGSKLRFPQSVLYKPDAFYETTWADAKWMARRITSITENEIREAVASSGWPDFMQEALAGKLLDRRNRIAELFDLTGNLDRYPATLPTISVALGSPVEIASAERRYGLPEGALQAELSALGAGPGYAETVVENGQVTDCRKGALLRVLARERHPAGLDHRYDRTRDEDPQCIR